MDGFLFGTCCQLTIENTGELVESDALTISNPNNNLYIRPTGIPLMSVVTAWGTGGLPQISSTSKIPGILPTAQDDAMIQIDGHFGITGVTHPTAPETIINDENNEISAEDFRPMEKKSTTHKSWETTPSYSITSPSLYVSDRPLNKKPIFRPKPVNDNTYVLVPTITHETRPNKTQEIESIVNIIQMLNGSTFPYSASTEKYATKTTYLSNTSKEYITTRKPPSTSYVFSTKIPPKRPSVTQTISSSTNSVHQSSTKLPTYVNNVTLRPAHSTFANSPAAFVTTNKPSSTSYVYSTTNTRKPLRNSTLNYHTNPTVLQDYPSYASSLPTVIVLSPAATSYTTAIPTINAQSNVPQRKPITHVTINNHITHNLYSTSERPSPTVLITPKPSSTTYQVKPITEPDSIYIEAETAPNDINNFPPVRNPNLNMSAPLFDDSDVTTPAFIEDDMLNIKVESFVNKILQGLQEPFHGLKDVVYDKNSSASFSNLSTTKRPIKKQTTTPKRSTQKPFTRPTQKPTTRRPTVTSTSTNKPVTLITNKRTRPTKPSKPSSTTEENVEQDLPTTINQDYKSSK